MHSTALTKTFIQAQEFVGVVGGWVGRGEELRMKCEWEAVGRSSSGGFLS